MKPLRVKSNMYLFDEMNKRAREQTLEQTHLNAHTLARSYETKPTQKPIMEIYKN